MVVPEYDTVAEKTVEAASEMEAMQIVGRDILDVIRDVADRSRGRTILQPQDFKVRLIDEQPAATGAHLRH
jgi:threonyl-tRNA synthetase